MIISKKNIYKLEYELIFLPLLARFFTDNFGVTYAIMPLFDGLALAGMLFALYLGKNDKKNINIIEWWIVLFGMAIFLSIVLNNIASPLDLFYSIRPYFRMIVAMLITVFAFNLDKMWTLFKYMEVLLYINVVVMTFQYVFMGLRQDVIGGTFGNNQGCNAIQNILCVFVFCVTIELYLKRKYTKKKLIINTVMTLYVSILAEINVLLFELVITAVILLALNGSAIKKRNMYLICFGICTCVIALFLFMRLNTDRVFLLSVSNILEYLGFNENSTGVYRISRMRVFDQLGNVFFKKDIIKWLFGFGLGNCSTHSSFYNRYSYLQYTYFSSSNVFLETGLCGVLVNLGILVNGTLLAISEKIKIKDQGRIMWIDISIVMTLIMILMFFYNTTLRDTYTAFFSGTIAAIPYIIYNKK